MVLDAANDCPVLPQFVINRFGETEVRRSKGTGLGSVLACLLARFTGPKPGLARDLPGLDRSTWSRYLFSVEDFFLNCPDYPEILWVGRYYVPMSLPH